VIAGHWSVVVVGGRIAGATTAWALAPYAERILVVDASRDTSFWPQQATWDRSGNLLWADLGLLDAVLAQSYALTRPGVREILRTRRRGPGSGHGARGGDWGPSVSDDDDTRTYAVVINDEEQYSIWPDDREPPAGWRREGVSGPRDECLAHIDQVWTDMRPLSLRRWMQEQATPADQ
jgi:MbtH protein